MPNKGLPEFVIVKDNDNPFFLFETYENYGISMPTKYVF